VITGSAIVATILAALVVSSIMYRQERTARQQAETARQNGRNQREQAEMNFGLARDAVDRLTDIAQNRLMDASDLAGVRRDMLEDAAKFYGTFAQARSDNPAVIIEAERAERRAATLHSTIGQPWEAEAHDLRAIALVEGLYNAHPSRSEYQTELGDCYTDLGRLYQYELNDDASAQKAYRRAKDLFRPLFDSAPENHDAQFYMYWACLELGNDLMACDRHTEALVELKQALKISEHFAALAPDDMETAGTVAQVRHRMGDCAARTGSYVEAEADFRASILIQGRIHVAHPDDEWTTYLFTGTKVYFAGMLNDIGRPQEAEKLIREAIVEIEPIAQRRSQYNLMLTQLAYLNENLGNSLFAQRRFAEAHHAYIKSRDGLQRIYEAHNDAPARTLAVLYPLTLCPDQSVRDPAAAASIARAALQRSPRIQLLSIYLGAALYQTADFQGAIDALEKAQQIGPNDLGFSRYILALAQFKSGRPELARASLAQAEHWATTTPPRFREPRFFATEARRVILGNAAPPTALTVPATMSADPGSQP
jgi:tetratricopeptide (TPR) repeat protein